MGKLTKINFFVNNLPSGRVVPCDGKSPGWYFAKGSLALTQLRAPGCAVIEVKSGVVMLDILEGRHDLPPDGRQFAGHLPPECDKVGTGLYELKQGSICHINEPTRQFDGMAGDLKWQVAPCSNVEKRRDQLMHESRETYELLSTNQCAVFWVFFDATLPEGTNRIVFRNR
jgi:hypothetical protein